MTIKTGRSFKAILLLGAASLFAAPLPAAAQSATRAAAFDVAAQDLSLIHI